MLTVILQASKLNTLVTDDQRWHKYLVYRYKYEYKYKYIGLRLAMQMKLNMKVGYRSLTHIAVSHAKYS